MPDYIIQIIIIAIVIVIVVLTFLQKRKSDKSPRKKGANTTSFTTDMTQSAREGKLDQFSGREEEIDRAIHIIMRRSKNNPLIIGEPGVGKTAIVEGLAQRIVSGDVPDAMKNKNLLSLDLNQLMAGTQFRGELEQRLRGLLDEVETEGRDYILFIDEIHLLQQAGKSEGALAISDVIKPALARGDLQVIGATTWSEYEEFIRPDEAFDRRMQPVLVDEPNPELALKMLKGLRKAYEDYHRVKITDAALEAAVKLSDEKIDDRYLPDKAIDLIDEAAAKVSIEAAQAHKIALGVVHAASKKDIDVVDVDDIKEVIDQWIVHTKEEAKRDARK
ncbi:MAG: AAA family ATPase [Patescibacteria group bacterium]